MSDPDVKTGPVIPDYKAPDPADSSLWAAIARRKSLVVVLGSVAFFLLSLIAYWPALRGDFIWDDDRYVSNNPNLQTLDGLQRIWIPPTGSTVHTQYYPLVLTSFWIEHHLWGLNPVGYHVVNVLLHALGATLLWTLLRRLSVPGAWAAAAIFLLHPVHVESVAWIAERKNVLSGVFYFATMLVLLRYLKVTVVETETNDPRKQWFSLPDDPTRVYAIIAVLFACALLSKTVTATLPFAALVILWWKRGSNLKWDDVTPLVPLAALGVVAAWYTQHLEAGTIGASGKDWDYAPTLAGEFVARCMIAGRAVWFYLGKLIAPFPLIFNYPRWDVSPQRVWMLLFPLLVVGTLAALWGLRHRIGRGPLVAALLFVGSLFPVLGYFNVYPFKYSFVADHFNYLPSVPIIALVIAGLKRGCDRLAAIDVLNPAAAPAGAAILLLALGILTHTQGEMYQNSETLFITTIKQTDQKSWWAANNYASWLLNTGGRDPRYLEGAEKWSYKVLRLKPDDAVARGNLGVIAQRRGKPEEAQHWYEQSLAADPNYGVAQYNVAAVRAQQGRTDEAIELYRKLVAQQADFPDAQLNLAILLSRVGRVPEAMVHYRSAVEQKPESVLAHLGLGTAYYDMNQLVEAAQEFDLVAKLDPKNTKARVLLGRLAMDKKRPDIAGPYFMQAVEIDPKNAEAWTYVGRTYEVLDKFDRAVEAFTRACELAPENKDYKANLVRAIEELNKHPATTRASKSE